MLFIASSPMSILTCSSGTCGSNNAILAPSSIIPCATSIAGVSRVSPVSFLNAAEHGNFLVTNGVEHGGNNSSHESGLLVIVHANDGVPVIGNFLQSVALANVRQVQDIFESTNRRNRPRRSKTSGQFWNLYQSQRRLGKRPLRCTRTTPRWR